jgi:ribonucleoside-diphosphate reductase alpha chain
MLSNLLFIPGGRILRNLGKLKPSIFNCNFLPLEDSIESIFETLKYYGIISSYGGGCGINFSALRPKNAPLNTKGGVSSGALSFLDIFNYAGKFIETGGSRRAAGIALMDISHPQIVDFITAKMNDETRLTQFNISIIINKAFLKAVESNENWELKFAGKTYEIVKARYLWNVILDCMLKSAEPGFVNWDNLVKNNSYFFQQIQGVNPCGELPLEAKGSCLLGSLVLPKFITNKNTNWQKLSKVIKLAVRFLDNIIDIAYYPIDGQELVVKNARRIGLSTMGLADYFFQKEIRYGSERSLQEIDRLYSFIRNETYIASSEIAKEKGAFPKFNKIDFCSASFVRKLPSKIRMMIREQSIRNCTLLTAAPTGSTSMLADCNSGIEPLPYKGYKRIDGIGERIYVHSLYESSKNTDWFVDSLDLKPEEHLEVQYTIGKYIDGGVSKTIILPEETTIDDLSAILLDTIYDLKGVTVYRNNSRKKQVYYRLTKEQIEDYLKTANRNLDESDVKCKSGSCDI